MLLVNRRIYSDYKLQCFLAVTADFKVSFTCCVRCFADLYVCALLVSEAIRCSGPGVKDGCKPPHRDWEPNPCPLQYQQMLLTAEPTLQSASCSFSILNSLVINFCGIKMRLFNFDSFNYIFS